MIDAKIELRWRNLPSEFGKYADEYAEFILSYLRQLRFTGTFTATPFEKTRIRRPGQFFNVKGVVGHAVKLKLKPVDGNVGWHVTLSPPSLYEPQVVADRLKELIGSNDDEEDIVEASPAVLVQPPAAPPPPPSVAVSPDSVLDRVHKLHSMAHTHARLEERLREANEVRNAAWQKLEEAEAEVEKFKKALEEDTVGRNAIAALRAIGGLL